MELSRSDTPKTILIVEDDGGILDLLTDLMEGEGFTVVPTQTAEGALTVYDEAKPDLIMTDISLPGISGLEFVQNIRKHDQITPIIIVTGIQVLEAVIDAAKLGADEFILKPFGLDQITSSVERLLSMSPIERENSRLKDLVSKLMQENKRLHERLEEQRTNVLTHIDMGREEVFYRSLAHDMKNELVGMGGALHVIRQEGSDSATVQELCDYIERSLRHLRQLMLRMGDHAKISEPHLEPINISDLIKRTGALIQPRIPSNIQFEITVNPNTLEGKVLVDAEQLLGVLLEVISNALHALRNSEGIIKLDFSAEGSELIIAISNNGPDIAEDISEKLFKQQVRSSKEGGTGMGLFLANQILKTIGGNIALQERSTAWITFTIRIPLYEPKKDA
jgi:signal transduction histidine kinase